MWGRFYIFLVLFFNPPLAPRVFHRHQFKTVILRKQRLKHLKLTRYIWNGSQILTTARDWGIRGFWLVPESVRESTSFREMPHKRGDWFSFLYDQFSFLNVFKTKFCKFCVNFTFLEKWRHKEGSAPRGVLGRQP